MKQIPFYLPIGHILLLDGRRIRFEEHLGEGILKFRYVDDENEKLVRVGRAEAGSVGLPDVEWALQQFRARRLVDPGTAGRIQSRMARNLELDRAACTTIDPLTPWRFDWADAAIAARITRTEDAAKIWIDATDGPGEKPGTRSLLRWMRKLHQGGGRIGALVNTSGRQKGKSQLSDVEDRLVQKWAMAYWKPDPLHGVLAHKENAFALMIAEWDELKSLGIPFLSDDSPSPECMRTRINGLECYSTWVTRYGRIAADRHFMSSGEPIPVERPFERIYVDGVHFEHSVFYSESVRIPSAKMKSVIAMDVFSQFVFPHPTFAGPFRPEMGIAAVRNVMIPPTLPEDLLQSKPELALFYSIPSEVMIDRDRTLIPPNLIPGAVKTFDTVELAEAYHSDAKAELENYNKFVKRSLRKIGGRILGPRNKHDVRYNPLANTEATRAQYVDLIEQCRLHWNRTGKKGLGWRSPNDVMNDFIDSGGPRLTDPDIIRRTFSSTPKKRCELTTNGLIYDNIQYRWNREGVQQTISSNYRNTPFADRIRGTGKVSVTIRTWEDDVDMIEVFDEENRTFHRMYSTEPAYTGGLSRWEHHRYQEMLRSGKNGAQTRRDRARIKARSIAEMQKILTGKGFRDRDLPTAMLEGEERRLSATKVADQRPTPATGTHVPITIDGSAREDLAKPPPQGDDDEPGFENDRDVRSNPADKIAEELGGDDPDEEAERRDRWKFSERISDEDEE